MKPTKHLYTTVRQLLMISIVLLAIGACKKMDATYREYLGDGEINYTSKADSLRAFPGENRIKLAWLATTDPKVVKAVITWNNGENSREHPISPTPGKVWEEVLLENMAEGNYAFQVITYDTEGNKSITSSTQGSAFGAQYKSTLQQRKIRNSGIYATDEALDIDWYAAPQDVVGTEVEYTNINGQLKTVIIPASQKLSSITETRLFTSFRYRTLLLPHPLGIDTFRTEYITVNPQTHYLRNMGRYPVVNGLGFERNTAPFDNVMGTLKDWKINDVVNTRNGMVGYGTYELLSGAGNLSMQGGASGRPVFTNGKIWQTTNLPAGKYRFTTGGLSISNNSINTRHQVVAIGDELPNRENLATQALAYNNIANPADVVLEFTLTAKTRVSIGFVASFSGGHWLKCTAVYLDKID